MKIYDFENNIRKKKFQEVTSSNLFTAAGTPDPDGLISNRIFGIAPEDRQSLYGYIDLSERFIHPLFYKRVLRRSWKNIDGIISGTDKYIVDEKGNLVPDEKGKTGISFLYDNFEKIKFKNINPVNEDGEEEVDASLFKEDVRAIMKKYTKEDLFPRRLMVIPIAFRDVDIRDGAMGIDELNSLYRNVLNKVKMLKSNKEVALFDTNRIRFQIQLQLSAISDHLKGINFGKYGLQRKRALSKNVDYGSVIVLSGRNFEGDSFEDPAINIDRTGFPLSSIVENAKLFISRRVQSFLIGLNMTDKKGDAIPLSEREMYYDNEKVNEYISTYVGSISERFTKILNPREDGYVMFDYEENGETKQRELTITDVLYMFAYTETELAERHAMVTRHPTMDSFNIIPTLIHVNSTRYRKKITAYGTEFPYYPDLEYILNKYDLNNVDSAMEAEKEISGYFIESQKMSNLQLKGQDGDLDGDKNIMRILFSDEANEECRKQRNKITFAFDMKLHNMKYLGNDSTLTMFAFTNTIKNPEITSKEIVDKVLSAEPKDITISYLFKELRLADTEKFKKLNDVHAICHIPNNTCGLSGDGSLNVECTLGQLILYKLLLEDCKQTIINEPWTYPVLDEVFTKIGEEIKAGNIEMSTFKTMCNRYESFSLRVSSFINPSLSPEMLALTPEIIEYKKKLIEENKEELEKDNILVASEVENKILEKVKDTFKDNPDFEFYQAGEAKLTNDFKVMAVMTGSLPQDTAFNKFKVVTSSLSEGIKKEDLSYSANTGVIGGYSRGKSPEEGGALAKTADYVFQTMMIDKYGTDCGTKVYPYILIEKQLADVYIGRYIINGGKEILLTKDNIRQYAGQTFQMRSVLTCKSKNICSKCAGEFIYEMYDEYEKPIAFGLKLNKQQHEIVQKRLKLSHDTTVSFTTFDFANVRESKKKDK